MAQGGAGEVYKGFVGVTDEFTELRKYDKDKSNFFIWKERGYAPFVHILVTSLEKEMVTDPEPRHVEDVETAYVFTPNTTNGSTSGTKRDIQMINNADALLMQAGDELMCPDVYVNDAGTYVTTPSATNSISEVMRIKNVGSADSGGSGYATVQVRRGLRLAAEPSAPTAIDQTMRLVLIGDSSPEGGGTRIPISQNPNYVENYTNITRIPFAITWTAQATSTFASAVGKDQFKRNAEKANRDFVSRLERKFIFSNKQRDIDATTRMVIRSTGGLGEWVPQDAEHWINYNKETTYAELNKAMKPVFLKGSQEKFYICGLSAWIAISNSFMNNMVFTDDLKKSFGLNIGSLDVGGGRLNVVPSYELSRIGFGVAGSIDWDKSGVIADTKYLRYMYLKGYDVFINRGPAGKGIQANDLAGEVNEIYAEIGLKRQNAEAHFKLLNLL